MRKFVLITIVAVIVAGAGYFGYRYYQDHRKAAPQTTIQQQPNTPEPAREEPKSYEVKVYFSKKPDSDNDPSRVFAVSRTSPDLGVGKFAMTELLKGPTEAEKAQGYFSTVRLLSGESNCGGEDFTLVIADSVATLRFCRDFDHLGVVADGQAESAIQATLKQFGSVQKVVILNSSSDCEFNLSGMNLCKQ